MKTYNCMECDKEVKWGHSKRNKFCSIDCQQTFNYKERVKQLLKGDLQWGLKNPPWVKRYIKETKGEKCECCNLSEWLQNPIPLELDHVDGNPNNNSVDNLRLLCPNCHSLTPSYKGKNKGNGRNKRYMPL